MIMLSKTPFRISCSACLLLILTIVATGCGQSADSAMYLGNEEATREHMKEVDNEEHSHAGLTPASAAAPARSIEGAGVQEEESRAQQMGR
jgi:hypothetical protein